MYKRQALGATATTLNATLSWVTKPLLVACDDGMLPKSLGNVNKHGVPWKLLTLFYLVGFIPLAMQLDIAFITKFTTANSLLSKLFVCFALFSLASKSCLLYTSLVFPVHQSHFHRPCRLCGRVSAL